VTNLRQSFDALLKDLSQCFEFSLLPVLTAMTKSTTTRKKKPPAREKAVNVSLARKLLEDLETVDHAITMARLYAGDKDDFRDGIEALVKVVDQQGKVLKDLLLALDDKLR
jgi:hypothetical protein